MMLTKSSDKSSTPNSPPISCSECGGIPNTSFSRNMAPQHVLARLHNFAQEATSDAIAKDDLAVIRIDRLVTILHDVFEEGTRKSSPTTGVSIPRVCRNIAVRLSRSALAVEAPGQDAGVRFRALAGSGLAMEEQRQWAQAVKYYEEVASDCPDKELKQWAKTRRAAVAANLKPAPAKAAPKDGGRRTRRRGRQGGPAMIRHVVARLVAVALALVERGPAGGGRGSAAALPPPPLAPLLRFAAPALEKPPVPIPPVELPAAPDTLPELPAPKLVVDPAVRPPAPLAGPRALACNPLGSVFGVATELLQCGRARFSRGEFEPARADLAGAVQKSTDREVVREARYWLAETLIRLRRADSAEPHLAAVAQDDPRSELGFYAARTLGLPAPRARGGGARARHVRALAPRRCPARHDSLRPAWSRARPLRPAALHRGAGRVDSAPEPEPAAPGGHRRHVLARRDAGPSGRRARRGGAAPGVRRGRRPSPDRERALASGLVAPRRGRSAGGGEDLSRAPVGVPADRRGAVGARRSRPGAARRGRLSPRPARRRASSRPAIPAAGSPAPRCWRWPAGSPRRGARPRRRRSPASSWAGRSIPTRARGCC